jgi:hypothetical protein
MTPGLWKSYLPSVNCYSYVFGVRCEHFMILDLDTQWFILSMNAATYNCNYHIYLYDSCTFLKILLIDYWGAWFLWGFMNIISCEIFTIANWKRKLVSQKYWTFGGDKSRACFMLAPIRLGNRVANADGSDSQSELLFNLWQYPLAQMFFKLQLTNALRASKWKITRVYRDAKVLPVLGRHAVIVKLTSNKEYFNSHINSSCNLLHSVTFHHIFIVVWCHKMSVHHTDGRLWHLHITDHSWCVSEHIQFQFWSWCIALMFTHILWLPTRIAFTKEEKVQYCKQLQSCTSLKIAIRMLYHTLCD